MTFIDSLSGASENTRRMYECGLRSFMRADLVLDNTALAAFDVHLAKAGRAKTTRLMYVQSIKRLLDWMDATDQLVGVSLAKAHQQLRVTRGKDRSPAYIPRQADPQIPAIVTYFDSLPLPECAENMTSLLRRRRLEILRNRALIHTFISTAARLSEVLSLTRVQVNDGKASETVIVGKGGFSHVIFFSPRAQAHIRAYCTERVDRCQALFVTHQNIPLGGAGVWRLIKNAAQACGMSRATSPHAFRHWVAWDMLNNRGVPLDFVQAYLGHKNIATTRKVYATTDTATLRRFASRYFSTSEPLGPTQLPLFGA